MKIKHLFCITFVLLAGTAVRLFHLGIQGLFLDEAWSWASSQVPFTAMLRQPLREPILPLYAILLKASLIVLPSTEAGLRALSMCASLCALIVIVIIASRWWGVEAAIYAGWFAAVSSFDVYYAQETRMYTLLGLFWLLSYVFLTEALEGKPRFLIAWTLVNVLLVWIHFYGLIAVGVQIFFLLIHWGWQRWRRGISPLPGRWLGGSVAFTICVSSPVALLLMKTPTPGGGAWVAQFVDLPIFFALSSVGLTAARSYFLDSTHLVLAKLAAMPLGFWLFLGLPSGVLFLKGLKGGLHSIQHRTKVLLAILLMVVPVAIAFGYSIAFSHPVWAFKPFLGVAYLFYLWAGFGLSRVAFPLIRWAIVVIILGIAIISFIPYYTGWKKTDVKAALSSLPTLNKRELVLYDRAYMAPVNFYYRGTAKDAWGITELAGGFGLTRVSSVGLGMLAQDYQLVGCDAPNVQNATQVWILGDATRIRLEWQYWPACLADKRLLLYENGQWVSLNP